MDTQTIQWVGIGISLLTIAGTVLATVLTRKGKRDDDRREVRQQWFNEMAELAETRREEIERKDAQLAALHAQYEGRFDRQLARCRATTDSLIKAIAELRSSPTGPAADRALRQLAEHREDDHPVAADGS